MLEMGKLKHVTKMYDQSLEYFGKALDIGDINEVELFYNMGVNYYFLGQFEKAIVVSDASMDDLKGHLSTVHLNWQPYSCSYCTWCHGPSESAIERLISKAHPTEEVRFTKVANKEKQRVLEQLVHESSSRLRSSCQRQVFQRPDGEENDLLAVALREEESHSGAHSSSIGLEELGKSVMRHR